MFEKRLKGFVQVDRENRKKELVIKRTKTKKKGDDTLVSLFSYQTKWSCLAEMYSFAKRPSRHSFYRL